MISATTMLALKTRVRYSHIYTGALLFTLLFATVFLYHPAPASSRQSVHQSRAVEALAQPAITCPNITTTDAPTTAECTEPAASPAPTPAKSNTHTFLDFVRTFPLAQLATAVQTKQEPDLTELTQRLTDTLLTFIAEPPLQPINTSCTAPPPTDLTTINCDDYSTAFSKGSKRAKPAKLAHAIQFGYDVDTLEVHLHEIYDLVDYIFIIEQTVTHHVNIRKPLMLEQVLHTPRFSQFKPKIIHLILDDVDMTNWDIDHKVIDDNIWWPEGTQENMRFAKIMEWQKRTRYFDADSVIGFGDADDITSRHNLQVLKQCSFTGHSVDIGIWFPDSLTNLAFRSDWPVPNHPYTYGEPTFYQFSLAFADENKPVARRKGRSGHYLLGGMHMSSPLFVPFLLMKDAVCTECSNLPIVVNELHKLQRGLTGDERYDAELLYAWERNVQQGQVNRYTDRSIPVSSLSAEDAKAVVMPWFLQCNPQRYPYWFGDTDPRVR